LNGERAIDAVTNRYYIIRTSWLYSRHGHNFYKTMLRLASEREFLSVVDDQIASPTYAKFLAEDLLHLIRLKIQEHKQIPYGIYHYTQRGETSWCGFAQEIMRVNEMSTAVQAVNSDQFPTKAKRPRYSKLCTNKWEKHVAIALRSWQAGVAACGASS
jgi:dTDP-4-dehydrorhamnose reductase